MKKPIVHLPEPTETEIQKKAYHLWVEGGCLEGVELDNWLAAKELLRHHHGRAGTTRSKPTASAKAKMDSSDAKPAQFTAA